MDLNTWYALNLSSNGESKRWMFYAEVLPPQAPEAVVGSIFDERMGHFRNWTCRIDECLPLTDEEAEKMATVQP